MSSLSEQVRGLEEKLSNAEDLIAGHEMAARKIAADRERVRAGVMAVAARLRVEIEADTPIERIAESERRKAVLLERLVSPPADASPGTGPVSTLHPPGICENTACPECAAEHNPPPSSSSGPLYNNQGGPKETPKQKSNPRNLLEADLSRVRCEGCSKGQHDSCSHLAPSCACGCTPYGNFSARVAKGTPGFTESLKREVAVLRPLAAKASNAGKERDEARAEVARLRKAIDEAFQVLADELSYKGDHCRCRRCEALRLLREALG